MLYPVTIDSVLVMRNNPAGFRLAGFVEALVYRLAGMQEHIENKNSLPLSLEAEADDVRQSKNGDGQAYRRLVESHQKYVGQLMWRFSRDSQVHEELVQDVFVEAFLSLAGFSEKAPFGHWLSKIATRVGYRYWKQTARRHSIETFSVQEWDEIVDEKVERMDASKAASLIYKLLAQLPPRDRLVLTLRYLEQCSVAETVRRTSWSKIMVKVQTWRALRKLEKLLSQAEQEMTQ